MTKPAILDALAAKMEEIWNDDLSFEDQAAAVLELVGPRELVWGKNNGAHCRCMTDDRYSLSYWPREKVWVDHYTTMRRHPTLEAAQTAAQAHADAAHWANTKIGGE